MVELDISTQEFYHISFNTYHIVGYFEGEHFHNFHQFGNNFPVKGFIKPCKHEDQAIRENYPHEMYMWYHSAFVKYSPSKI